MAEKKKKEYVSDIVPMEAFFMESKTKEKIEQAILALTDLTENPEYTDLVDEIKTAINYLNHINDYLSDNIALADFVDTTLI